MAALLHGLPAKAAPQRDEIPAAKRAEKTRQIAVPPRDNEQRRAAVREALEAQRGEKSGSDELALRGRRQLSPEERKELRQQLRQPRG